MLRIDTDRYTEASGLAASAGRRLVDAGDAAGAALRQTGGMAGWDAMGAEWAAAYDPAAHDVLAASRDLALATSDTARALALAAGNYITAEHAASMGLSALTGPLIPPAAPDPTAPFLPSACGADAGFPPLHWDLVAGIAGVVWPAGDPARLRAASATWTGFADGIAAAVGGPSAHARHSLDGFIAEDLTLFRERSAVVDASGRLVAQASRDLAEGCRGLADAVEAAHQELEDEARSFALECLAMVAVGTALSLVTLGGSAAVTALVGAARTAQMVARVHQVLSRLGVLARTASVVAARMPGAARLTSGLRSPDRTSASTRAALHAGGRTPGPASGAGGSPARLSRLAPAVRVLRPVGAAGLRVLDSRAVSVALSSPAALAREQVSRQVRRRLAPDAAPGGITEQVLAALRTRTGASPVVPAVECALRTKERVDTAVGLVALPRTLRDRYAPGRTPGLPPSAAGPGRLTAVQGSPATGPTASSSRARRRSHPGASP
ncbi:WXG100-like domain-containing protein [Arthrobacter sp. TMS1-12-1]